MKTIGDEGNGRNLPLFNAIKSTGTFFERYEKPSPPTAAAGAPPGNPPKPPKKNSVKKEKFESTDKKKPDEGFGGLVRNKK